MSFPRIEGLEIEQMSEWVEDGIGIPFKAQSKTHSNGEIYSFLFTQTMMNGLLTFTKWWFQIFFMFTPIWGRFPIWLIFFKRVESTNRFTFDSSTWNSTLKSWPEVVTWDHDLDPGSFRPKRKEWNSVTPITWWTCRPMVSWIWVSKKNARGRKKDWQRVIFVFFVVWT